MVCGTIDSILPLAARGATKRSRAPRSVFTRSGIAQGNGPEKSEAELRNLYNGRIHPGESIRVFPLSKGTEMDVWQYIHEEYIPVVDLYFARERPMYVRGDMLLPIEQEFMAPQGEKPRMVKCRLRSLGCRPCTGASRADAETLPDIIAELNSFRSSERANRVVDHGQGRSLDKGKGSTAPRQIDFALLTDGLRAERE
jgi:sulfate adenylyltransferase subunit 2